MSQIIIFTEELLEKNAQIFGKNFYLDIFFNVFLLVMSYNV